MPEVSRGLARLIRGLKARVPRSSAKPNQAAHVRHRPAQAGHLLSSSLDLGQVLDRFANITLELMPADLVSIWLLDEDEAFLRLASHAGVSRAAVEPPLRPERGTGLAGHILSTGQPLAVDDIDHEPRVRNRAWFTAEGVRSFLGVPLGVAGTVVGVMAYMTRARRHWSAADVEGGQALATAAAVAMQNARLHGETRDHLVWMRGLAALNHVVTSSLDLQQVLEHVAEASLEIVRADLARVWVVDEAGRRIRVAATRSRQEEPVPGPTEVPLDHPFLGSVLASRAPRYSANIVEDPLQADISWARAGGFVSRLAVPLVADERALGVLAILTKAPRRFSPDEDGLLTLLAAKAATAIESVRLYEETRERLRETETLLAVGRAVNSTLDFTEAMRRVARETGRALGADMVGAYLADPDREFLWPVAGYHVPRHLFESFLKWPIPMRGNEYILEGWRSQQPAWSCDAQTDPRTTDREFLRSVPVRSVIFFPLTVRGEPIGGLFLIWWTLRPAPTMSELSLLEGIARQTALAIENAQLFEARARDAQRLQALNEVSRSLTASLDPREVFGMIAKFAAELLDAQLVRLWVLNPATKGLGLVASSGADAEEGAQSLSAAQIMPCSGLVGTIFETKRPEFIADLSEEPRWLDREMLERLGLRGFAGLPLVVKDEVVGVLALLTRRRGDFTAAERSLIEAFASQAAFAIHNAQLFKGMERSLRETQALLRVADSFSSTPNVDEIMRRVCREATRALRADSGVFYTADERRGEFLPVAGYRIPKAVLAQARPLPVHEVPLPIAEARRARQILFVPDVMADARYDTASLKDMRVRSILMSPIYSKERFFGDVLLYWWDTAHDVDDGDLALMAALSAQAALALENGRLLVETQSHAAALREKNAELDSFVYTVSHDLKSPLLTIEGMASLVLEEHAAGVGDEGRHYLERIKANIRQMERLLGDLLALSRIGREARPAEAVNLAEVIDEILVELTEPLRVRGIKVVRGDMPTVSAIRVQMEQVFRNLLTNAVKYSGDGPSPAIEIGAMDRGAAVECWVRDTGIGIDPDYYGKIFDLFHRLKDIEAEGTGVGLSITKKIVEAAGGRIWVESARGQGSTFRFTWPTAPRR